MSEVSAWRAHAHDLILPRMYYSSSKAHLGAYNITSQHPALVNTADHNLRSIHVQLGPRRGMRKITFVFLRFPGGTGFIAATNRHLHHPCRNLVEPPRAPFSRYSNFPLDVNPIDKNDHAIS